MAETGTYEYLAARDAKMAQISFIAEEYSVCGRFCEQSVEKYLKAYLSVYGNKDDVLLLNSHKPKRLYEACVKSGFDKVTSDILVILADFSDYYYDTNYPGDNFIDLTKEQAENALEVMKTVNNLIKNKLNKSVEDEKQEK